MGEMGDPKDHLANERTFLAWIRTNLGIMAFGFVLEKFSFFSQKINMLLGNRSDQQVESFSILHRYAFIFGISIIGVGAILSIFAFLKFKKTEQELKQNLYQSSALLDIFLLLFIFGFGLFLILYLVMTFPFESH